MRSFAPGEPVVLRELWRGRVFAARPATVLHDGPELVVLLVPAGVTCAVPIGPEGEELRIPDRPWRLELRERGPSPVLSFAWPGEPYAVLRWSAPWAWYVNLQEPLRRTRIGYDTTDHVLDVLVAPDGTWEWKDEEDLERAVALGLFTPADAERFRADGHRAVRRILEREPPLDHDWTRWQPDPSWPTPTLPEGWDAVARDTVPRREASAEEG
jgi:hypothetical protein